MYAHTYTHTHTRVDLMVGQQNRRCQMNICANNLTRQTFYKGGDLKDLNCQLKKKMKTLLKYYYIFTLIYFHVYFSIFIIRVRIIGYNGWHCEFS